LLFADDDQDLYDELSSGDVILFYSEAEPASEELEEQPAGLIGAAIIDDKYTKEEDWWWKEYEGDEDLPLVAAFDRVFYTGAIDDLDFDLENPITEKDDSELRERILVR